MRRSTLWLLALLDASASYRVPAIVGHGGGNMGRWRIAPQPQPPPQPQQVWLLRRTASRSRLPVASAASPAEPEPPDEPPSMKETGAEEPTSSTPPAVPLDMSALRRRMDSVQEADALRARLEALPHAWVLVYDEDTEDEAVYSMEMEEEDGAHVVLAFEERADAVRYARSLVEETLDPLASVLALDVEALVVTSRDANFRVGLVFAGDLTDSIVDPVQLLITGPTPASKVDVSITMVPDAVFEGRTANDLIDPAEDPVWVLVQDEGTADAQFFQMRLHGTDSVVCFKDEVAAARCAVGLRRKGTAEPTPRALLLADVLDQVGDESVDVCLVDEVVETVLEGEDDADAWGVVASDAADEVLGYVGNNRSADAPDGFQGSVVPSDVRVMLNRLYASPEDEPEEGAGA